MLKCRQWRWQGQRLAGEVLARIRPESQSRHSSSRTISSLICEQVFLLPCYVSSGSFPGRVRVVCQKAATMNTTSIHQTAFQLHVLMKIGLGRSRKPCRNDAAWPEAMDSVKTGALRISALRKPRASHYLDLICIHLEG